MNAARRFRDRALEIRKLAAWCRDPGNRLQLYVLAADYDEFADDLEFEIESKCVASGSSGIELCESSLPPFLTSVPS